ncbi:MAG: TonB family protein [Candidatus Eisenbacteria bacterium]|nr:TonB family protein [Candidatus Eisenbacteria bacterium]
MGAIALPELKRRTAFFRVKKNYAKVLEIGFVGAAIIHAMIFYFSPPYVPHPYVLPEKRIEVLNLPEDIGEVPPLPEEIERPVVPAQAEISDDVSSDATIAPTEFNPFSPLAIPSSPEASEAFYGYDSPPEVIRSVKPAYPEIARETEAEGLVQVEVTIDETGRVIDAKVVESDTIQILNNAALKAAREFLFRPAKQMNVPVKCRIVIPFRFSLGG